MVLVNEKQYLSEFIQLNEAWITHYFKLEDADIALANNPARIIEDGGYIFSLVENGHVVGVCALFKDDDAVFQLARMAVKKEYQGKGYGEALLSAAIAKLREIKASRVYLLSNTLLIPAINLYKKYGFTVFSMGQHPVYARCDIVMEKLL